MHCLVKWFSKLCLFFVYKYLRKVISTHLLTVLIIGDINQSVEIKQGLPTYNIIEIREE